MNTALVLELDGMTVPVDTDDSTRKARLTIEADGSLRLRAAGDVATDELQRFLASKREWVYRKLSEKELLLHEPVTKELVDGEGFLYLGRSYRLRVVDDSGTVRLERGRLLMPRTEAESGEAAIVDWYRTRGVQWLRPRVAEWAQRLRVEPTGLEVADLGHKWGSATVGRRIRVHWATLQLRPSLVEYVLAHELAHLREPHHGPQFWQLLGRVLPDFENRKHELGRVGAGLWVGGPS
ncbi:MAG: M48 family metallopeptidase [Candidatus Saccharibacteria bacterium]|nr:M48 family metallopeptidase [Microbacteriaceae bacterium]